MVITTPEFLRMENRRGEEASKTGSFTSYVLNKYLLSLLCARHLAKPGDGDSRNISNLSLQTE